MKQIPIAGPPKGCYVRELRSRHQTLCPRCSEDVRRGHAVWDMGSAEVETDDEERLGEAIREGRWREARRDFGAASKPVDIRAWQAIRCPDGVVFVAESVLPFELWNDDAYERIFALTEAEQREIREAAVGEWVRR